MSPAAPNATGSDDSGAHPCFRTEREGVAKRATRMSRDHKPRTVLGKLKFGTVGEGYIDATGGLRLDSFEADRIDRFTIGFGSHPPHRDFGKNVAAGLMSTAIGRVFGL